MTIQLVDLKAQFAAIRHEIEPAMAGVLASASLIGGAELAAFESEFAAFCEAKAAVGVGNGTDALYLALRALGLGPGDEVITVANTFIATSEAISLTGATPVFVDVLPDTLLMDPDAAARAITPRTRAIVPVHLYGQVCDMDRLLDLARTHGLKVVEDAAQAHGARWNGRRAGTMGDAGCFSFYPGKNLGAYGDGGAVVSNDAAFVERVRQLANHGRRDKYVHLCEGVNSRLDTLQAAVLRVKLRHLDTWNQARRVHAAAFCNALAGVDGVRLTVTRPECEPVWHLFTIRVAERERFQAALKAEGIATGVHYPIPLHRQPAYAERSAVSLPVTEAAATEILSLPMYPELQLDMIDRIIQAVVTFAHTVR